MNNCYCKFNLRRAKVFFITLTFFVCMTACAVPSKDGTAHSVSSSSETPKPEYTQKAPSITLVTSSYGLIFSQIAASENGFYQILTKPDGTGNILYSDYKSEQTVYLSSQISSTHNSSEDQSFIESCIGGIFLGQDNEYVYGFKIGNSELARVYGDSGKTQILKMDNTGANRLTMILPANIAFLPGSAIVSDTEHLYVTMLETNSDTSTLVMKKISVEKSTMETVEVYDNEKNHFIMGAFDRKIVMKSVTRIKASPVDENYAELGAQQKHCLYLFDIDSKEKRTIAEWTQGEFSVALNENIVYMYNSKNKFIERIDCKTFEKTNLPPLIAPEQLQEAIFQMDLQVLGEHLFFNYTHEDKRSRLVYNLKTGQADVVDLKFNNTPLNIYDETEDFFLVLTGDVTVPFDDFAPDGTPFKAKQLLPQYSLISKTDFFDNNPNYKKFATVTP